MTKNLQISNCNEFLIDVEKEIIAGRYIEAQTLLKIAEIDVKQLKDPELSTRYKNLNNMLTDRLTHSQLFEKDSKGVSSDIHSLERLKESHRQLVESESIASETLVNLYEQRKKLELMKEKIKETNDELTYSQKILRNMSQWWRK